MVIGAIQKLFDAFFYLLCMFLDFSAILGHLRYIRPFSGSYEKKQILSIYVIFSHFRAVTIRSKVLFSYSSRYSKFIGASQIFLGIFCFVYVCFFIFRPFWGIYIIFGHFRPVTKRSKVIGASQKSLSHFRAVMKRCKVLFFFRHDILRSLLRKEVNIYSLIRHDILRSMVKVKKILRRFVYCLCVFLDFSAIYVIFGHFWELTKRSKVLFSYSSRYSMVIGASRNIIKAFFVLFNYENK
ncbi:hypothetical protein H5410_004737 [Solanum commersonii]|uniref:Uncharacterized protein n=1 Tax=Solanum commersonii TaxID=4109 RepID=A0A9J6A625_SOLCO|nr:hypothetical protein H5410_004737 [Solanum commersonii]